MTTYPGCPLKELDLEIVQRIADGEQQKQIARTLGLGRSAVSIRMLRAREKVGALSMEQLVAMGVREGWLA